MLFNSKNFFRNTYCEFQQVDFDFSNINQFESKSGSKYHYTEKGVYRYSNHWGRVANCRWKLSGVENYKNQNWYVGYANWSDFFALNSTEKCFFVEVDLASEEIKISVENNIEKSNRFLFSIGQAIRRKKEIQQVLKNDKWLQYIDAEIDEIKKELVIQLTNSSKKVSEIKSEILKR